MSLRVIKNVLAASGLVAALAVAGLVGADAQTDAAEEEKAAIPEMTQEELDDPALQEIGVTVWQDQCRHCHGASAYPGKAPRLTPRRYDAEFVYDRTANGFRGMPAWKDVYSDEEIRGVVAYILSRRFSP